MLNISNFRAVIFDMDGVIVDNQHFHLLAWEEYCYKHNFPFDKSTFSAKYFGKNNHEIILDLSGKNLSFEETFALGEEKEELYRKLYANKVVPIKGLVEFLKRLKANNTLTGIATSAPISNLDFIMDSLQIRSYFNVTVDASMVHSGKPNPEIYLKASELLATAPSDCLVFEDSHSGILSAQNARMQVIALATTHKREELNQNLKIIDDYSNMDFLF